MGRCEYACDMCVGLSFPLMRWLMSEVGKDKFNLTHGSILGISHDFFNVLAFRTCSLLTI